ncbi:MAG: vitamin B12-dependent ribonucleotide reductase [bacterium]
MKITRRFTKTGTSPYEMVKYTKRDSSIKNPDGTIVFELKDVEVPTSWSQMATDILAQKYFRRVGVPQRDEEGKPLKDKKGKPILGAETSVKQVIHRLAQTWKEWGEQYKYFDTKEDAAAYYDELVYMLLNQMAAPNSPQWFNTGLSNVYGITGAEQGHFFVQPETGELKLSEDAYTRPQPHACFIQHIDDNLLNEGGIFDLATREARIFKYGSGTGSNFSTLRAKGEKLSGGGNSSGLMSFLKIFDRAAGAIKSGGTTRRAAKMVIVDIDHPDVEEFIEWKAKEEEKVAALVAGSKIQATFMQAIMEEALSNGSDLLMNKELKKLVSRALHRGVPFSVIKRTLDLIAQGFTSLDFDVYNTNYEGEGYVTVSGQNSNNSIRITNDFLQAVENDEYWELKGRTDPTINRQVHARDLWNKINMSAWKCADPGLQFDTTINEWNTCPNSGRINASNPCSEYMFLDDTACNLASLNLVKFFDKDGDNFLVDDFNHAARLWTIVLEISVLMAQFPSKEMAIKSFQYRTLGIGYANLGTLLMINGIPYDSPEALAWTGAITALLTGVAYETSAEMAKELGAFSEFDLNKEPMLKVVRNHRRAVYNAKPSEYEDLTIRPLGINPKFVPDYLLKAAQFVWDEALELGSKFGFRNAQVSVLAPTGTIGLVMDCDTTGIEPDFAIVKYKKLSGGGYFKIVNQSVQRALVKLGYTDKQIEEIVRYSKGAGTLTGCPFINRKTLATRGFTDEIITEIEKQLDNVFDIRFAFNKYSIGEEFLKGIGIAESKLNDPNLNLLSELGFTQTEIEKANDYVCGTMMIEGAPNLKEEHLPVFDTASKCGKRGTRYITHMAHVRMMSAAQPFITGAISKTVNMHAEATVSDIAEVHLRSWKAMLKSISIYRDGSKLSQPLSASLIEGLDELVLLGDEYSLDETKGPREVQEIIADRAHYKLVRHKLPKKRKGFVREAYVGGHKVFLRTGDYEDGSLGEIFIDMYKEGASFRALLNSFAILTSKAIQYGVPLEELVDTFIFTRFDPAGPVDGHEAIKNSTSILDYVFRTLGYDYLGRTDFIHVKAVDESTSNNGHVKTDPSKALKPLSAKDIIDKEEREAKEAGKQFADDEDAEMKQQIRETKSFEKIDAVSMGYTGEMCTQCGSARVKRNGSCIVCEDCGSTSGCS